MGTTTSKLKLTKPYESDTVSINVINANMDIIDNLVHVVSSGTATSTKYAANSDTSADGNVTWRYKKYDDGTFSANCKFETTNLRCNGASSGGEAYWSGSIKVNTPNIGIASITDCQMHVAGNCMNWVMNITGQSILNYVTYRLACIFNEGTEAAIYKQMFIHIEGTWK